MTHHQEYGDEEARRIIARAAAIDADRRMLDATSLRAMAANAGISPVAVDQALREHETMETTRAPWTRRYRSAIIVASIIAGLLLFVFARAVVPVLPF